LAEGRVGGPGGVLWGVLVHVDPGTPELNQEMADHWSLAENEALVADYVEMLECELRGEAFSKASHWKALKLRLGREKGSIERKHQNVSAILIELGFPYIDGYKPLGNYQKMLHEGVAHSVRMDQRLAAIVQRSVQSPAAVPGVADLLARWENPPDEGRPTASAIVRERPATRRTGVDWLEVEARNQSLGRAGEEFVLTFERARLIHAGKPRRLRK
jgi:hypothetical protein